MNTFILKTKSMGFQVLYVDITHNLCLVFFTLLLLLYTYHMMDF